MSKDEAPGGARKDMRYKLGDLEIDEDAFAIRRNGALVSLEPRVFELVVYLIRNRARMITKDELIDRVWHGYSVGTSVVTRGICIARAMLKHRDAIRTVHGRGYQWVAPVFVDRA